MITPEIIREGLDKTEYEKNGWQIIILEYQNRMVKGRYELAKWASGSHNGLPFETYRKNFIKGLTKVLIDIIIPPEEEEEEEEILEEA